MPRRAADGHDGPMSTISTFHRSAGDAKLAGVPVYVGTRWWQKRSALTVPEEVAS